LIDNYEYVRATLIGWYNGYQLVSISRAFVGVEAAHIATLIGDRGTVFAFGALPVQIRQLNQRIFTLGLNSILDYKT